MDIKEKQARWALEKPLFEAEFIHSHLLPFFNFNENTGDYEIKSECVNNTDDEDRKVAYETLNTGWVMWLRAKRDAKAQAVLNTQALHDRLLVKSIREHVESHISEISVNDLFDKGWLAAMKCIQNNIDMLEAQEQAND